MPHPPRAAVWRGCLGCVFRVCVPRDEGRGEKINWSAVLRHPMTARFVGHLFIAMLSAVLLALSAGAFVVPSANVQRMAGRSAVARMQEDAAPPSPIVTRAEIATRKSDSQSGGGLAVYVLMRPKLEQAYAAANGDKNALLSADQLKTRA